MSQASKITKAYFIVDSMMRNTHSIKLNVVFIIYQKLRWVSNQFNSKSISIKMLLQARILFKKLINSTTQK